MYWELAADEALIVEFDAHDGLWMLTNMGVFFNSMDYLYLPGELHPELHQGRRRQPHPPGHGAS